MENVTLCLSLFAFGLKIFMALLRFELQKCLVNVFSTLSMSLVTCHRKCQMKTLRNSYNSMKGFALCPSQPDMYVNLNNSYIKNHIYANF